MNRFRISFFVFVAFICFSSVVNSKELIREFNGSESKTTADFEVEAPWIVDWRTNGDYPGQMAVEVGLINAATGQYEGKVTTTKYVNNGVKLFTESGVYRFQIDSTLARWTLRVEELTRQEAETYLPKEKKSNF
jgi:hypothetical protein